MAYAKGAPGKALKISPYVSKFLERKKKSKESFDALLRRLLGLPTRKGREQRFLMFWALPKAGLLAPTEEDARGLAVRAHVRTKRQGELEEPIPVREVR